MYENNDLIIKIIENTIVKDTIDAIRPTYGNWKIGYSHERLTPHSDRLFIWKVGHIDEAKKIVDYFKKKDVHEEVYEGTGALTVEWLFFYHK